MKRALKKTTSRPDCYHPACYYYVNGKKIDGVHKNITGDVFGITGDVSGICGDVTGVKGNVSDIKGDVTGVRGDVSDIEGDLDDCDLTQEKRNYGVNIEELICKESEDE